MSDPRIVRTEARAATFARVTVVTLVLGAIGLAFAINQLVFDIQQRAAIVSGLPRLTELSQSHTALVDLGRVLPAVFGVAVVSWLGWQFEAHRMLWRTSATRPRFRPGVAVAAWAVPAANVIVPPLAMAELWWRSDPRESPAKGFVLNLPVVGRADGDAGHGRPGPGLHGAFPGDEPRLGGPGLVLRGRQCGGPAGDPLAVALIAGVNGRQRLGTESAQGSRTWSELRERRDAS